MTIKTLVKVCGVTRLEDALEAASCGVDALGFNFYSLSPRHIDVSEAASISTRLPDNMAKVGLFVNADVDLIEKVLIEVDIDFLQFMVLRQEKCARHSVCHT